MRETSSSEFAEWQVYLRESIGDFSETHHYLARIALEIARTKVKNPRNLHLKDFLINFKPPPAFEAPKTKEEVKKHINRSKAAWMAYTNIDAYSEQPKKKTKKLKLAKTK